MANVLIIDDDEGMCYTLSNMVRHERHNVTCAHNLRDGIRESSSNNYDVVFLDVMMPDGNGLDVLPEIRETASRPEVIIITAVGNPDGAELAIKNGAWDYIQKPFSIKEMTLPLFRALQYREEKDARKLPVALKREGIVGSSPKISACLDILAQAAQSNANVLITGETGTGKELFSFAIHKNSSRASNNFVVVDCTTLPETLVEAILFGHEKGAFTGADKAQEGLIKQADGGTLFLDEICELPFAIQKGFLRVLQEHRFRPLGGKQEIESNFRIVAATNRDLDEMVKRGHFRKDLLFRLQSINMVLPSLRERPGDINELAMHHITRLCERYGTGTKGFSPEFFEALTAYDWPGNVRELFNALERTLAAAHQEPTIFPIHLPTHIRVRVAQESMNKTIPSTNNRVGDAVFPDPFPKLRDFREEMEKKYLQDLIRLTTGNIKEVCQVSGMSRSSLYDNLKRYKISITE